MAELPILTKALVDVLGEEVFDEGREDADVAGGVDEAVGGGGWEDFGLEDEGVFGGGGDLVMLAEICRLERSRLTSLTMTESLAWFIVCGVANVCWSGPTSSSCFADEVLVFALPCINHSSTCLISSGGDSVSFSAAVKNNGTFNPLQTLLPSKDSSLFSFVPRSCK